jgi:SHS2 domain-containing protein
MNTPTPWKVQAHSGDLRISAYGRDQMEALAHASYALLAQIFEPTPPNERELRSISVSGDDESARFIAFLNELIFLIDARSWVPVRIKSLTTCARSGCDRLEAVLSGEPLDSSVHIMKYDVKAVTYHDFQIRAEENTIVVSFVCDL